MKSEVRLRTAILASLVLLFFLAPPFPSASAIADPLCASCHGGKGPSSGKEAGSFSGIDLKESAHKELACVECHADATTAPHVKRPGPVDCGRCHTRAGEAYWKGVHGEAVTGGDKEAPSCTSCHGPGHRIFPVSDFRSPMFRGNLVRECVRCHTDAEVEKTHKLPSPEVIKGYEKSVHGRLQKQGRPAQAALCTDCHGDHLILSPKNLESKVNRTNIPVTCGRCHGQIYNEYKVSIHGRALKEGKAESPSCTDCHGEHTLTVVTDPRAPVYQANVPATCSGCHENQTIIRKYGLPSDRYSTYIGSFHGVAVKYGNITAANCTSCHEVHRILPASEAESSISPQNLPRTCGRCHPAMSGAGSIGKIHVDARRESSRGMYYVRRFYVWFIGGLMFLFICYIALDIYGGIRRRRRDGQGE